LRVALVVVALVGGFGGCVTTPAPAASSAAAVEWRIALLEGGDADVGAVETRLCFRGPPPKRVAPENRQALPWLLDLPHVSDRRGGPGRPLDVDDDGIVTADIGDDACIAFVVDIEAAARAIDNADVAALIDRAIVGSPDAWLWRPSPFISDGRLVVNGDADLVAALPFPKNDDGSLRVSPRAFKLQCFTALGRLQLRTLEARGARFQLARTTAMGLNDAELDAWLRVAIDDVAVPLGRFPVDDILLLLVPTAGRRQVLSGFLGRGGGASALFYLGVGPFDEKDDPEILDEDGRWVFTHELAHTLLPPIAQGDGWLNEGITTWQQEVLPAAVGRRERGVAEGQLAVGFRTGAARAEKDGLSAEDACRLMAARGSHQHCYWAGARLMALLADDVGDEGVFALVRLLHGLHKTDATPTAATDILRQAAATAADDVNGAAAARQLLQLWETHRSEPFPTPRLKSGS